jgi:hypothetical protein
METCVIEITCWIAFSLILYITFAGVLANLQVLLHDIQMKLQFIMIVIPDLVNTTESISLKLQNSEKIPTQAL